MSESDQITAEEALKKLLDKYESGQAFRLWGLLIFLLTNEDTELKDAVNTMMYQDIKALRNAGVVPEYVKTGSVGKWTRRFFNFGLNTVLKLAKRYPDLVKDDDIEQATLAQKQAARKVDKKFGLGVTDSIEKDTQEHLRGDTEANTTDQQGTESTKA